MSIRGAVISVSTALAVCVSSSAVATVRPIAAPTQNPLAIVSLLGSQASQTAYCSAAVAGAAATQGAPGNCVLPAVDPAAPPPVAEAAPPVLGPPPPVAAGDFGARQAFGILLGVGLAAIIAALVLNDDGNDDDDDEEVVSPA